MFEAGKIPHSYERHTPTDRFLEQWMIQRLLDSDLEVVFQSGFIHVPLLFDPSVDREIRTPPRSDTLIQVNGRQFVKAVSVQSLLENYPAIHPESCEELRKACLREYADTPRTSRMPLDAELRTILFQVMPHFIRGHRNLERGGLSEGEILDLIGRKINIPAGRYEEAGAFLDTNLLWGVVKALEEQEATLEPPTDGLISSRKVGEWIHRAMEQRILAGEKARIREVLGQRRESGEAERRQLAVLLHIAQEGSLEIDGFGFSRIGSGGEYLVYKRTGEYALKDYYGRIYLFPACRVAVSTLLPLKPFVAENYKHPFLEGHDSGQDICMRGFSPPNMFPAAGVITALEEGISALLHGYSGRRRNGYHSLDRMPKHLRTVDFEDAAMPDSTDYPVIRKRHALDVDFDDYRVSRDHPQIASSQVPVTNEYTP